MFTERNCLLCVGCVCDVFWVCLGRILGVFGTYFGCVWDVFWVCLGRILGEVVMCVGCAWDVRWVCLGRFTTQRGFALNLFNPGRGCAEILLEQLQLNFTFLNNSINIFSLVLPVART
jgi:hypothetical protein